MIGHILSSIQEDVMGQHFPNSVYTRLHHSLRWWSLFYFQRDPVSRNEGRVFTILNFTIRGH